MPSHPHRSFSRPERPKRSMQDIASSCMSSDLYLQDSRLKATIQKNISKQPESQVLSCMQGQGLTFLILIPTCT